MIFENWAGIAATHRRAMILTALVTTFAGVALIIDRPKGSLFEWLSIPFLVLGGGLFVLMVWPNSATPAEAPRSLASRFLAWITLGNRLVPLFPAIGVGVILADVAYNLVLSSTPAIQTEDTIVLLGAATLIGYNALPKRFARERDFTLLFFICLNAILVVPLLIARAAYLDFEKSVDVYSWVALAPQTSAVLNLLGVSNTVHPMAGSTAPGLTFTLSKVPVQVTIVITTACSGIYSFGIFASAFVAFVSTEYAQLTKRVWLLLGLGLGTAYLANVFRMVVIILVGYYTDSQQTDLQNMLIAHSYAGWLIFIAWITLFWSVLLKVVPATPMEESSIGDTALPETHRARCAICMEELTPAIPAFRCACGSLIHRACSLKSQRCPRCSRTWIAATSL